MTSRLITLFHRHRRFPVAVIDISSLLLHLIQTMFLGHAERHLIKTVAVTVILTPRFLSQTLLNLCHLLLLLLRGRHRYLHRDKPTRVFRRGGVHRSLPPLLPPRHLYCCKLVWSCSLCVSPP